MKKIEKCILCGAKELKFLFYGEDKNFNLPGKFPIVECEECGLISLGVSINSKDASSHYPPEYYSFKDLDTNSQKFRTKLEMYNCYFNKKNKNWMKRIFLSPLIPFIRGTVIEKGKKLLDVGCGSGQFLYEMKQFNIKGQGLEPGDFNEEQNHKYGLNIKKKNLLEVKYPKESFDLITMNHVLEHVENPTKNIKEVYRILKRGGNFIIAVPNKRSLAYFLLKKDWYQLDTPRHVNNFSDELLKKNLEKEGFKIDKVRYNSRPTQFTISFLYLLSINPKRHSLLRGALNLFFLPLTYLVNAIKLGDQIEVWCSK